MVGTVQGGSEQLWGPSLDARAPCAYTNYNSSALGGTLVGGGEIIRSIELLRPRYTTNNKSLGL